MPRLNLKLGQTVRLKPTTRRKFRFANDSARRHDRVYYKIIALSEDRFCHGRWIYHLARSRKKDTVFAPESCIRR